jgi:hypothetical protein
MSGSRIDFASTCILRSMIFDAKEKSAGWFIETTD